MNLETFLKVMDLPLNITVDEILNSLIIYLRKSRKDMEYYKDEPIEKTLQRHEKELQEFITRIFGKPIPEHNIYREVVSGDTIEDRPVMQEVLSIIENENKKGVVCVEIERLARGNTIDQGVIAQTFQYTNTRIITLTKIYNLSNEDDLSYFEDGLFQARKYLKYVKRILNNGRKRSVKDGKTPFSVAPYGFNREKLVGEKGFILVENEAEAKILKLAAKLLLNGLKTTYTVEQNDTVSTIAKLFGVNKALIISPNLDLKVGYEIGLTVNERRITYIIKENDTLEKIASFYNININQIHIDNTIFKNGENIKIIIDDMGTSKIAKYFNYLNIKPRKAERWTANMIRNILLNYSVYGYLTWDRRKTVANLENGKIVKSRPVQNDFLITKGKHKPILSEEIGKRIQEKLKSGNTRKAPNNELKNHLAGLVICGYCGRNMTRRPYYDKQNARSIQKRKYKIDKEKLRLCLREHKGNYSLRDIATLLKVNKTTVDHWFSANKKSFIIPYYNKWYELKKLLNIETTEFDKAMTILEEKTITPAHIDTLLCNHTDCKCVGSDLALVEKRIIETLSIILKEYKEYTSDYKETVKNEIDNNQNLIDVINNEINKINNQLQKACELVETGVYTQDLFIKRTKELKERLNALEKQKNELNNTESLIHKFNNRQKAIPILEEMLKNYKYELSPTDKNEMLSKIIDKVIYKKEKGGRYLKENFTLDIVLRTY